MAENGMADDVAIPLPEDQPGFNSIFATTEGSKSIIALILTTLTSLSNKIDALQSAVDKLGAPVDVAMS